MWLTCRSRRLWGTINYKDMVQIKEDGSIYCKWGRVDIVDNKILVDFDGFGALTIYPYDDSLTLEENVMLAEKDVDSFMYEDEHDEDLYEEGLLESIIGY